MATNNAATAAILSFPTERAAPASDAKPTIEQATAYQAMFDRFNRELFGGTLPQVVLNFSREARRAAGFFSPERWRKGDARLHEISLNPEGMQTRPAQEVAAVLVHEMVHLWQKVHGKKYPTRPYHNKEFAEKMLTVGLTPSRTGKVGGAQTGASMSHYVTDGGAFSRTFDSMPADCLLPWAGQLKLRFPKPPDKSKIKHVCPNCDGVRAYCKEDARIKCGRCGAALEKAD